MTDTARFAAYPDFSYWLTPEDLERSAMAREFVKRLRESQEPLGKEFEEVLHENLWDLYER